MEQKFNDAVITPMAANIETINNELKTASGQRKVDLEKEKKVKEEAFATNKKNLEDSKTLLANLPKEAAEKVMKTATENPAMIAPIGKIATARKEISKATAQKVKYEAMKNKVDAEDQKKFLASIAKIAEGGGDEKPKPKPDAKPEGGGDGAKK